MVSTVRGAVHFRNLLHPGRGVVRWYGPHRLGDWYGPRSEMRVNAPQRRSMNPGVIRCMRPVPEPLRGAFQTAKCTRECARDGTHVGDHKASITIPGCGKITWTWKNRHPDWDQGIRLNLPPALRGRRPGRLI